MFKVLSTLELDSQLLFMALAVIIYFIPYLQAKNVTSRNSRESYSTGTSASSFYKPKTFILGFSKGGTVLNQLVTELGHLEANKSPVNAASIEEWAMSSIQEEPQIIPRTKESLLNSINEIHYVDVGLNTAGAYITDSNVIQRISKRLMEQTSGSGIRFVLHGTPRQWSDSWRVWIRNEKDKLVHLLESESQKNGGKLQVCERFYFADKPPDMQMHFEIIESMDVS